MFGKALLKIQDYISILMILGAHLKQKYKNHKEDFITFNLIIITGITLSIISTINYGHPENICEWAIFYVGMILISVFAISVRNKKMVINRILYEIKYIGRMFMFMAQCYQNTMSQYLSMVKPVHNETIFEFYNMIVISTIFKKLFKMYFDTIDAKDKNPEPYLIDVQEMTDIYSSREFNNFYSAVFFNIHKEEGKSSYEQVIIKILDEVMSQLYTKSWFVDNYDDEMIKNMIRCILTQWYDSIAKFESNIPLEAFAQ